MRKIIFRGKNIHTGEWLYGDYHREGKTHYITTPKSYSGAHAPIEFIVDEKTLGQFTGLLDKSGKEIYSDDYLLTSGDILLNVWFCEEKAAFLVDYVADMRVSTEEDVMPNQAIWADYLGTAAENVGLVVVGNRHDIGGKDLDEPNLLMYRKLKSNGFFNDIIAANADVLKRLKESGESVDELPNCLANELLNMEGGES